MRCTVAALGLLMFMPRAQAADGVALPAASNVIQRVLARAQELATNSSGPRYAYQKRAVTEELDANEKVIKSTEKIYKVLLIGGLPFQKLVKIHGRELTTRELERENQRENGFRQRISGVDLNRKAARKEGLVTQGLIDRFDYKVVRRDIFEGRSALVLSFTPKASAASDKTIGDKILSQLSGSFWVDELEYDVARLHASVQGPVNIGWLGAIASLHRCQLHLERSRLPDGVWVNAKNSFLIVGRKLFTTMRFRTIEQSSGFHRE